MKQDILKYVNYKLGKINWALGKTPIFDLSIIESVLSLFADIKNPLDPQDLEQIFNNRRNLYFIIKKYAIINENELNYFNNCLKNFVSRTPGFDSIQYIKITNLFNQIRDYESRLYDEYDRLLRESEKAKGEIELLETAKKILLKAKNDLENERVLTNESFVNFITGDKENDNGYSRFLLHSIITYNEEAMKNYVPMNQEQVITVLRSYGYEINSQSSIEKICLNYRTNVLNDILKKISELGLGFKSDVLIKILETGTTVSTIENAYQNIMTNKDFDVLGASKIYNFWISKSYKPNAKEKFNSSIVRSGESHKSQTIKSGQTSEENSVLNSDETFATAEHLKKYSFYNKGFKEMKTVLKVSVEKIIKREKLLGLYGIDETQINDSTTLCSAVPITLLDQYIELGLKDYIMTHLASLNRNRSIPLKAYLLKKQGVEVCKITNGLSYLTSDASNVSEGYDAISVRIGLSELDLSKRYYYDSVLSINNPDKILPQVYKKPLIIYLENYFKFSEYEYKIGSFIISRKKVLRLFSSFINDEEISFETFLYVMTYQRIADNKDLRELKDSLRNVYAEVMQKTRKI